MPHKQPRWTSPRNLGRRMSGIPSVFRGEAPAPAVFNQVHPQAESSCSGVMILYCCDLEIQSDSLRELDELPSCNDAEFGLWFVVEDCERPNMMAALGDEWSCGVESDPGMSFDQWVPSCSPILFESAFQYEVSRLEIKAYR